MSLIAYLIFTLFNGLTPSFGLYSEGMLYKQNPFWVIEGKIMFRYDLMPHLWISFDGSVYRTFEKDTLSYRDPFSRPMYYPYSFDKQPVITHYRLFDVKWTRGYIAYKHKHLVVKFGRDTLTWPSKLFIYGNGYPFDFLYHIRFEKSPLVFSVFNAGLNDTFELKRLAAQLVRLNVSKDFTIYLSEGVVYTRENILKYINPVALYYVLQRWSNAGPENLMGLLGIRYKGIRFFFLNDDFIIDRGGTSKYGTELDVKYRSLNLSFIRIPRYTYTHYTDTNNWAINNIPIGYPYGPDVMDFYLNAKIKRWKVKLSYLNHGEGVMKEHWLHSNMPKNPPVPSGIVEHILGIDIKREIGKQKETGIFFYRFNNYKNIKNVKQTRIGVYFKVLFEKTIF